MKSCRSVTLAIPVDGTGPDYAEAIALAIADANCSGDMRGAAALAGLMCAIKLPPAHNPVTELGPWLADIGSHPGL